MNNINNDYSNITKSISQLIYDYTQLCQRDDKSIYGIASGKQCRKGKPISFNPNDLKLGVKPGLKQVRVKDKDKVKNIVAKAKAIGLNNKEIRQIKEEVKQELNAKRVKGKEALKLFAKKANQLAKEKRANTTKPKPKPGTTKPIKPDTPKSKSKLKPSGKDHKEYIRAGEENHKEVLSKLRKLKEEYDAVEKIKNDFFNKRNNVGVAEGKQAIAEKSRILKEAAQILGDMRSKYLDRGDKDKAEENTKDVMDATLTYFLPFRESVYRDTLYTLNRFTNNTVNTLSSLGYNDPRAATYPPSPVTGQSIINVGKQPSTEEAESDLWHEFGHHVEFSNPDLLPAMKSWIQTRASGKLEKLSVLTGDPSYKDDEVAWAGNFGLGPYVGKDYESATEVISMGLEKFSTPSKMFDFYLKDPEHFALTLGVLDSL